MGAKSSLLALLVLCIVLGLARMQRPLAPAGSTPITEIDFWNGFTGPDGRTMLVMIREFNQANPDVRVSMQRMEWATYYNKLMVAGLDGRGPDVFVIHASTLARMRRAGFIDSAESLFSSTSGLSKDDFDPYVLGQIEFDGQLLGLPLDIHPQGLYCNAKLFREAGIVNPDGTPRPPRTREEFVEDIRKLNRDTDGDGKPDVWGFAYTMWRWNFMTLVQQFGGRYFDEDGRCVLDDPKNVAALETLASFHRDGLAPDPENNAGWIGFRQERVAMVIDGVYMLGDLKRLDGLEYVGAPIPPIGPAPGAHADSHVLCIHKGLTPDRRAAVERFIRFLSDHSLEWAGAGQVPARRSVRTTDEFKALPVQYEFSKQIPYLRYPPKTVVLFEFQIEVDLAVEKVLRGRTTAAEALKVARENVQRFMDREGFGQ